MDSDRDGYVDSLEMGIGLQRMFPSKKDSRKAGHIEPALIFKKIDAENQGNIFLSDMQKYVQAQVT